MELPRRPIPPGSPMRPRVTIDLRFLLSPIKPRRLSSGASRYLRSVGNGASPSFHALFSAWPWARTARSRRQARSGPCNAATAGCLAGALRNRSRQVRPAVFFERVERLTQQFLPTVVVVTRTSVLLRCSLRGLPSPLERRRRLLLAFGVAGACASGLFLRPGLRLRYRMGR